MDWDEIDEWEKVVGLYESYLRKSVEDWAYFFGDAFWRLKNNGRKGDDVMVIASWFFDHFKAFF